MLNFHFQSQMQKKVDGSLKCHDQQTREPTMATQHAHKGKSGTQSWASPRLSLRGACPVSTNANSSNLSYRGAKQQQ